MTLKFISKKSPLIILTNASNKVAQNIKWTVALWNLDDPKMKSTAEATTTPEFPQPLQIPVQMFDFIRPHLSGGPINLFNSPLVLPHVKDGDRLIGSASVVCPDFSRGHTFIVYIILGEGGWYYEINEETSGNIVSPAQGNIEGINRFHESVMASVKEQDRINIGHLEKFTLPTAARIRFKTPRL